MKKNFLILTLIIIVFSACSPAPQYTVKELTAQKAELVGGMSELQFTDGVIVYLSEENGDYMVVTGQPFVSPEEFGDDDFIIVRYPTEGLKIGDVVSITSIVLERSVDIEEESVRVQYLAPRTFSRIPMLEVTGHVDIEDPDFEALIQAIRDDISKPNRGLTFFKHIFLNPANPLSPLYRK